MSFHCCTLGRLGSGINRCFILPAVWDQSVRPVHTAQKNSRYFTERATFAKGSTTPKDNPARYLGRLQGSRLAVRMGHPGKHQNLHAAIGLTCPTSTRRRSGRCTVSGGTHRFESGVNEAAGLQSKVANDNEKMKFNTMFFRERWDALFSRTLSGFPLHPELLPSSASFLMFIK